MNHPDYKTSRPNNRGFTLVEIMIVVAIIGLLAAVAIPNFVKSRLKAQQTGCITNLRQIDGAKEQWALENKKSSGTSVVESEINAYIKGRGPVCAGGGVYSYNALDVSPTCSIPGHTL